MLESKLIVIISFYVKISYFTKEALLGLLMSFLQLYIFIIIASMSYVWKCKGKGKVFAVL